MTHRFRTRISGLIALVALAATVVPGAASARTPRAKGHSVQHCANTNLQVSSTDRSAVAAAVVCLVNQQRRRHGLPVLKTSLDLDHSAQGWSNRMVADNTFSHGSDFSERISASGFHWKAAGENIAAGYTTPFAVVRAWMGDVGHCQNILRPMFDYVGTGLGVTGNTRGGLQETWTQDFGLLAGTSTGTTNMKPAQGCPYKLSANTVAPSDPQPTLIEPSGGSSAAAAVAASVRPTSVVSDGGPALTIR